MERFVKNCARSRKAPNFAPKILKTALLRRLLASMLAMHLNEGQSFSMASRALESERSMPGGTRLGAVSQASRQRHHAAALKRPLVPALSRSENQDYRESVRETLDTQAHADYITGTGRQAEHTHAPQFECPHRRMEST